MRARIIGTGSWLPEHRLTNEDLAGMVETSDAWIRERTGIEERRLADRGTAWMAARAAEAALENAGLEAGELDLILVGTMTPDEFCPGTACRVQEALGASRAACMDLGAACSGFLYALATAQAYLAAGMARTALVIGAETLSKVVDWSDRSTCILFGDGAGAAVVRAEEQGVLSVDLGTDGSRGSALTCPALPLVNPAVGGGGSGREASGLAGDTSASSVLRMDGRAIFQFAVRTVPETVRRALKKASLAPEEISLFLFHQANLRILQATARSLKIPLEKVPVNIQRTGNTAAASVPILLDEVNRAGRLKRGEKLVLAGFGAGLTWGSVVLEW